MAHNLNTNFSVTNNNGNNINYNSNQNLSTINNLNLLSSLSNEVHLFDAFNTYKVICLEFISIFCNIKKNKASYLSNKNSLLHVNSFEYSTNANIQLKEYLISSIDELKLLNLILKAIKTVDINLENIIQTAIDLNIKIFNELFFNRIESLVKHNIIDIRNLMNDLKIYFIVQPNNDPLIRPWSILGRYVRRCIIIYEKITFDRIVILSKQTSIFLKQFKNKKQFFYTNNENTSFMELNFNESNFTVGNNSFHKQGDDNNLTDMDLDGSIISLIGEPDTCSSTVKLKHQQSIFPTRALSITDDKLFQTGSVKYNYSLNKTQLIENSTKKVDNAKKRNITNPISGCALSRKTAEHFVSQQAFLIENNDIESLPPTDLQNKIDELFNNESGFSEMYYLKFLNSLRIRDYTISSKCLHDYFDRFIIHGSISLAALNLVSLEYRFSNKENAIFALKEAITSAHQDADNACLQHCLSWLYKLISNDTKRRNYLAKNACSRAINFDLTDLASYNLHFFSRNNTGTQRPNLILDLLNKTDIINLKMNSKTELTLLNRCQKSSIWNVFGNRKISNLYTQLLLNLLPKSGSHRLNTESQCIGICYVSADFSKNGSFKASQNTLEFCKSYHSIYTNQSKHWINTENMIQYENNLLLGKWMEAKIFITKLASCNLQKALLEEMGLLIMDLNLDKAKEVGKRLLLTKPISEIELSNPLNNISLKFNHILISLILNEYSKALVSAIKLYYEIKKLDFNYELMLCCLLISKILLQMDHPEQAIKYLKKCVIFLNSYGNLIDQCKLFYLYARSLHMISKKNLKTSVKYMYQCVEKLEKLQAIIYLKSAYSYLSLLLHETGNIDERNKYALKYRILCIQHPLIGTLL